MTVLLLSSVLAHLDAAGVIAGLHLPGDIAGLVSGLVPGREAPMVVAWHSVASAARAGGVLAVKTLPEVIEGLRAWVMGILAAVATLFLVIGGLRYMAAAGDPSQVEQAKGSFKAALTGYALAVLAPVILQVLRGILGG